MNRNSAINFTKLERMAEFGGVDNGGSSSTISIRSSLSYNRLLRFFYRVTDLVAVNNFRRVIS